MCDIAKCAHYLANLSICAGGVLAILAELFSLDPNSCQLQSRACFHDNTWIHWVEESRKLITKLENQVTVCVW